MTEKISVTKKNIDGLKTKDWNFYHAGHKISKGLSKELIYEGAKFVYAKNKKK